jgi:hypothetical protein
MDDLVVFDRLARELDSQERRSLLVRIQSTVPVYTEALQPEGQTSAGFVAEQELAELSLLGRIILLFKSLFLRKDRATLLQERYLRRLVSDLQRDHPTLIDYSAGRFLEGMYEELLVLRKHARSLHASLEDVLAPRRREFISFLARNELWDFRERLEEETNPRFIWENGQFREETEVRTVMLQRLDELMAAIPQASKQKVGRDVRAFFALYDLSRHPFGELLSPFEARGNPTAAFKDMVKPLKALGECLETVRIPPSAQALYDLFLFLHQERLEDPQFDLERQLMDDMSAVHADLAGIRRFRERVPLNDLLRLSTRDPQYRPVPRSPGGHWFTFYRDFWHQWVHHRYLDFFHSRKRSSLLSESLQFLNVQSLPSLENYRSDRFGKNIPVRHELSLCLIKGFLKEVFSPLSRALKLIYLNAEFYKQENRRAYTDAFVFLSESNKKIEDFESVLGPQGELRAAIQDVKSQALGETLRRKRILDILARADGQARVLVDAFLEQVDNLKALLYGILKGQPGDRYDTLVNLNSIGGRENSDLRKSWSRALEKCGQAAALLGKIRNLEINQNL